MAQSYSVLTPDTLVMLGNSVMMSCTVPGHLTHLVTVTSWRLSERGLQGVSHMELAHGLTVNTDHVT